jgi:aerobic-type carbon monoxide dehydrogenase small subunit (CoxS/CutS family)
MILGAYALLKRTPHPARTEIIQGMEGNLCRCGSHTRIIDAIEEAAQTMDGWASQRAPQ